MKTVSCKVTMIENEGVGGVEGLSGGVGVYWGAGRECRYSAVDRV